MFTKNANLHGFILMFATLLGALALPMAASAEPCTELPKGVDTLDCTCEAGATAVNFWGSGPYTADSNICAAAVHAGVISAEKGGAVHVQRVPGLERYPGSTANGVTSGTWGPYDSAFVVTPPVADLPRCITLPKGSDETLCNCPGPVGSGSVWGTGPYTADSNICAAAVHAGVISAETGGAVRVTRVAGQKRYDASTANGVKTRAWGPFASSIVVARAGGAAPMPKPAATAESPKSEACGRMPAGAERLTCACSADQTTHARGIWGSGPYTADSDLCSAAVHAGLIAPGEAGEVKVLRLPGLERYRGSEANGVRSSNWGNYDTSITFDRN